MFGVAVGADRWYDRKVRRLLTRAFNVDAVTRPRQSREMKYGSPVGE
jgi:hypothetical protein